MISCFRIFSICSIFIFFNQIVRGQCVPNLIGNVSTSWSPISSPEINFNNARRQEETARGLPANSLGNMAVPPGGWASLTDAQVALYIHNSERSDRGCPQIFGVESHLNSIATAHTTWQISNDVFTHTGDPSYGTSSSYLICPSGTQSGSSMDDRIDYSGSGVNNCWETLAENLSIVASGSSTSSSFNNMVAKAIFNWIYKDSGSAWGHREAVFLDFTDNYGNSGNEGFIGVGNVLGTNYASPAFSCSNFAYVRIVTINYYDPQAAPPCSFVFSSVLPVELLSFDAKKNKSTIDLSWETASERSSDYFLIERSPDGEAFEPIGQVSAAGDAQSLTSYSFQDKKPLTGMNYYRLRELDKDGTETLSKIVSVQNGSLNQVQLYPNPTKDYFLLVTENKEEAAATIEVRNSTGNLVYQQGETLANNNTIRVSTDFLTPGVYWVTVIFDNLKSETLRMVKL